MTVYADYAFYTNVYLVGKSAAVTDAEFPYFARKASSVIDRYTFGNVPKDDVPEEVRLCCCELAEMLHAADSARQEHEGLTSEEVGGWRKSYEGSSERYRRTEREQRDVIRRWLSGTGLLYGGVST